MKLYFAPHTRAVRVRWFLEELGLAYELAAVDLGAERTEEHLSAHPMGKVPALVDGSLRLFETTAILAYLSDRYGESLGAVASSAQSRATVTQWLAFAATTLELPVSEAWASRGEANGDRGRGQELFSRAAAVVERKLEVHPFVLEDFSAADVAVGSVLIWARSLGLLDPHATLQDYCARLTQRPAYRRARS